MHKSGPIGIFDSGIGGLSIARRIRELLPNEDLLYVADSEHAPYGEKTPSYIIDRASAIVEFLIGENAKAIVVACNTATVSSIKQLRDQYKIPIIGVEPGVKPAVLNSSSGVIGVLATTQTLNSGTFNSLADSFSSSVRVEVQPCPGLVEQIEAMKFGCQTTESLLEKYVNPLLEKDADHIVLGCTHYAFISPVIKKLVGPDIEIINTDLAVAKETLRRLQVTDLLAENIYPGNDMFWTSGDVLGVEQQIEYIWGCPVKVGRL